MSPVTLKTSTSGSNWGVVSGSTVEGAVVGAAVGAVSVAAVGAAVCVLQAVTSSTATKSIVINPSPFRFTLILLRYLEIGTTVLAASVAVEPSIGYSAPINVGLGQC
jgi:hypothetical protein